MLEYNLACQYALNKECFQSCIPQYPIYIVVTSETTPISIRPIVFHGVYLFPLGSQSSNYLLFKALLLLFINNSYQNIYYWLGQIDWYLTITILSPWILQLWIKTHSGYLEINSTKTLYRCGILLFLFDSSAILFFFHRMLWKSSVSKFL